MVQVLRQRFYAPKCNLTGVRTHDHHLRTAHFISLRCLIKLPGLHWLESFIWGSELMICYEILYLIVHAKSHKKIAAQLLFLSTSCGREKLEIQLVQQKQIIKLICSISYIYYREYNLIKCIPGFHREKDISSKLRWMQSVKQNTYINNTQSWQHLMELFLRISPYPLNQTVVWLNSAF